MVSRYALAKNDFEQCLHCLDYLAPPPLPYWNKEQSNLISKGVQSLSEPDFDPSMTNQKCASGSQFLTKQFTATYEHFLVHAVQNSCPTSIQLPIKKKKTENILLGLTHLFEED